MACHWFCQFHNALDNKEKLHQPENVVTLTNSSHPLVLTHTHSPCHWPSSFHAGRILVSLPIVPTPPVRFIIRHRVEPFHFGSIQLIYVLVIIKLCTSDVVFRYFDVHFSAVPQTFVNTLTHCCCWNEPGVGVGVWRLQQQQQIYSALQTTIYNNNLSLSHTYSPSDSLTHNHRQSPTPNTMVFFHFHCCDNHF